MIDIDALDKFLDESNELIKNSKGLDGIAQCKPLCSFRIDSDGDSLVFAIEARGFIKDEIAFFLVARQGMDDSSKFISRGYFTANEGHCTSFAMSHDEPRGISIQQGVLIEMRNIVGRMNAENQSQFLEDVLKQLNGVKVKIQVVESDGDVLSRVDDAGLGEFKADALDFIQNATGLYRSAPAHRSALTGPLTGFQRLGGNRTIRENANPDLTAAFDMTHHGNTGGLNLLAGQMSVLHGLQADVAKGNGGAARGQTAQTALLPFAEFNFLGRKHYCSTSLSRISPLYIHTLTPMMP